MDSKIPNTVRVQHMAPQFHLRNFSPDEKKRSIYAFDKVTQKSFLAAINRVAYEDYFYDDTEMNRRARELGAPTDQIFESFFAELEAATAPLISSILDRVRSDSTPRCTLAEKFKLAEWVAAQIVRTRAFREQILQYEEAFKRWQLSRYLPPHILDGFDLVPVSEAAIHAQAGFGPIMEDIVRLLYYGCFLRIGRGVAGSDLITSDNPAVRTKGGLGEVGNRMILPISFDCAIIFERNTSRGIYPQGYDAGIYEISRDEIDMFNYLQVRQSYRQVFGITPDFTMVDAMIKGDPSLTLMKRPRIKVVSLPELFAWSPVLP